MFKADELMKQLQESADYIRGKSKYNPKVAMILGSGLGAIGDQLEGPEFYPYEEIPNFPVSTVEGHAGRLVIGKLEGKEVIAMQGRFHYYEGYKMYEVTFPVRVMKLLGVENIIVTNSAGAVNKSYIPGDLMLIRDHLNLSGFNALLGPNMKDFGPRFPDMSDPYTKELRVLAREVAAEQALRVQEGVYAFMSGPTYETAAEVKMTRTMGADAVGMSTVPEIVVAIHAGMKTLGISCMTNMAAGVLDQPLNHEEVIETSAMVREQFIKLMLGIIKKM